MNFEERLQQMEVKTAVLESRLGKIEADVADIHRLATATELLAQQMAQMQSKMDGIGERLDSIEAAPARQYTSIKTTIISSVVTTIMGVVIGGLLALIIK